MSGVTHQLRPTGQYEIEVEDAGANRKRRVPQHGDLAPHTPP
ncbi:Uncharacterised protein [Mycobacterium tuberculosis]|nr:Uncharacterised protein [Mycobacterium tuberculosis]